MCNYTDQGINHKWNYRNIRINVFISHIFILFEVI